MILQLNFLIECTASPALAGYDTCSINGVSGVVWQYDGVPKCFVVTTSEEVKFRTIILYKKFVNFDTFILYKTHYCFALVAVNTEQWAVYCCDG